MIDLDRIKEHFAQHLFLVSERFVAEFLFQFLSRHEYSAYQGVFFNHLLGTDKSLDTRRLGFDLFHCVEHQNLGTVSLVAKSKNEALLIEPLFYRTADSYLIASLTRIMDACYQDCSVRKIHILTLKHRLGHYKGGLLGEAGANLDGTGKTAIAFSFWDEILASFRDLGHRQPSTSPAGDRGLERAKTSAIVTQGEHV